MKTLKVYLMLTVLVLGINMVASANFDTDSFDVTLEILTFAQVVVPEELVFEDINFADGFSTRDAKGTIELYTNDDVHLSVSSQGFGEPKFDGWQNWVSYRYKLQDGRTLSWHAGSSHGGWGEYGFDWTGAPIMIPFEARFKADADDWWEAQAGTYTDTLTVTVSAR